MAQGQNSMDFTSRLKIYSGGWVTGNGGISETFEPATGKIVAKIATASQQDIDRAAVLAAGAQPAWAACSFEMRAQIIRKAAEILKARTDELMRWQAQEAGSAVGKAGWEINASYEQMHMAAALPHMTNGALFPSSVPGRMNICRRVPIGVVGVISPWNFPTLLSIRSVAPALALGNAVLLKPDLQTTISGGLILADILAEAGLPENVLHVLPGGPATGAAIVRHPDVRMISFTGSTATGQIIGETAGRMLKKVALELGGNNAFIVLDDADLDLAASHGAWGAFLHSGQICMQAGRHLVQRSIVQAYTDKLVQHALRLRVGDPMTQEVDLGPLISVKQRDRLLDLVSSSIAGGAKVACGGDHHGLFVQPTVLTDVTPDLPAFKEELFGPVAPITVFDTDEEAVALVNNSPYGLSAGIHTSSSARGMKIVDGLRTGMVHVNDQPVNNEFQVPFGGMGASGNGGRFGGPANVDEFTQMQWVSVIDRPIPYPF